MRLGFLIGLLLTASVLWVQSASGPTAATSVQTSEGSVVEPGPSGKLESAGKPDPAGKPGPEPEAKLTAQSGPEAMDSLTPVARPAAPSSTHYQWWTPFDGYMTAQRFARYMQAQTGLKLLVSATANQQYEVLLSCEPCDLAVAQTRLVSALESDIELVPVRP